MEFKNNSDGIKRVIGRNFSAQQGDDIQEQENTHYTNIETKNRQNESYSQDYTLFWKKLNIIPFSIFLVFALIVIWQRDTFVPHIPSYNYQNITTPQTSSVKPEGPTTTTQPKKHEEKKVVETPKPKTEQKQVQETKPKTQKTVQTQTQTKPATTTTKPKVTTNTTKPKTTTTTKSNTKTKSDIEKSSDWFFE